MKKFLAVFLSMVFVLLTLLPIALAQENDICPTIMVTGYSSSHLYLKTENGKERVWGNVGELGIVDEVLHNIAQLGIGLGKAAFGNPDYFAKVVAKGIVNVCGDIAFLPNGTSKNDIEIFSNDPAKTNYKYLIENENGEHCAEREIATDISKVYGQDGLSEMFIFQNDFRKNVIDNALSLDKYIDRVLEYTGAEKVNLYAVSYGGQISATYLNLYGHLGKVNNAVLTVPAIGGAALAYDVLSENVKFDEETLFYFLENGFMMEEDINWLMKAHSLGFLDDIINLLIKYGLRDVLGYWGSIWDFLPIEHYDELKEKYLDNEESALLIEKSDKFHYEILPKMNERLTECINNGTNIYVVAGSDNPAVTGSYEHSDGIIFLNGATGATAAPFGSRFADGYRTIGTNCCDDSHNHLSPAMDIDATTCYLPEQTWIISGFFHGMTWKDEYTKNLCLKLLFSDELLSVHSDENYPQFKYSSNTCHSVVAQFNNSKHGFVSSDDTKLIVTNLSKKYKMHLISIASYGADIKFNVKNFTYLKPGESIEIDFSSNLPKNSFLTTDIVINYALLGSVTARGERNLTFTVLNGPVAEKSNDYDFVNAKHNTAFDDYISKCLKGLLDRLGFFDYFKMIFNCFINLFVR